MSLVGSIYVNPGRFSSLQFSGERASAVQRLSSAGNKTERYCFKPAHRIEQVLKKVTVKEKLIQVKSSCKQGKLVDATGREIRFFRLEGCWGNPPADYQEILQKQSEELEKLRSKYTVIEMTCNPDGVAIP